MMTKAEFIETAKRAGVNISGTESEFDSFEMAAEAAISVRASMPAIGFGSVAKRINCFMSVCRHLDDIIGNGELDLAGSQIALNILRLKDKNFRKAIAMFDQYADRYGAGERAEMPRSAREYLAGLQMYH